jgi:hypothetical protein
MAPRHGCVLSRAPVTAAPLFKGRHANFQTPIWAQIRLRHAIHSAVRPAAAERLAKAVSGAVRDVVGIEEGVVFGC